MLVSMIKEIEKIMRDFLWGSYDAKKKMSWVSWSRSALPKSRGGIGIKKLKLVNKALHCKWIWRYGSEKTALWRRIICEKFGGTHNSLFPNSYSKTVGHSL